eukprot:4546217-Pleurochrysis_carterae.AAC.1
MQRTLGKLDCRLLDMLRCEFLLHEVVLRAATIAYNNVAEAQNVRFNPSMCGGKHLLAKAIRCLRRSRKLLPAPNLDSFPCHARATD